MSDNVIILGGRCFVLFRDDSTSKEMMDRYANCFSPQLQDRIVFRPGRLHDKVRDGSFTQFVEALRYNVILF